VSSLVYYFAVLKYLLNTEYPYFQSGAGWFFNLMVTLLFYTILIISSYLKQI